MNDYWERYCAWRDAQVCVGCNAKCPVGPSAVQWATEYLCMPCWQQGVRALPKTMFDGYTGTVYEVR